MICWDSYSSLHTQVAPQASGLTTAPEQLLVGVGDSWTQGAWVISQPLWKVGMALGVRAGHLLRPVEDKGGGALPSALSDGASMGELVCQLGSLPYHTNEQELDPGQRAPWGPASGRGLLGPGLRGP